MRLLCTFVVLIVVVAMLASVACDGSAGGVLEGSAEVHVLLTDAPSEVVGSAIVSISRVVLMPGSVDLLHADEAPKSYDLMQLRDGVQALLADRAVPAGTYNQLRLVVDEATVTLAEGYAFSDGTTDAALKVPSGMQSGIKVKLSAPIEADDGTITIVVVDFDVDENFVLQGNPDSPSGIHGIQFTPVLHEKSRVRN